MNDSQSALRDDAGPPKQDGAPVSVGRRRFAKGAAPVLLGTLASKPVLGAPLYHCTVSGQISGNLSRPGDVTACVKGDSRSTWLLAEPWSGGIVKGDLPNAQCKFPGKLIKGTIFNGFQPDGSPALKEVFFRDSVSSSGVAPYCAVVENSTSTHATMFQVLNTDPAAFADSELLQLGQATVVSLLNSFKFAPDYPVTPHTVIAMFNDTYLGGGYKVNPSVTWDRATVISYLTSLYP